MVVEWQPNTFRRKSAGTRSMGPRSAPRSAHRSGEAEAGDDERHGRAWRRTGDPAGRSGGSDDQPGMVRALFYAELRLKARRTRRATPGASNSTGRWIGPKPKGWSLSTRSTTSSICASAAIDQRTTMKRGSGQGAPQAGHFNFAKIEVSRPSVPLLKAETHKNKGKTTANTPVLAENHSRDWPNPQSGTLRFSHTLEVSR